MNMRKFSLKLSAGIAGIAVILTMTAPMAAQAATTIIIDDNASANDCGKFNDKPAETNPVTAIGDAPSGSTIIVCPGSYTLSGPIVIDAKKMTIKRALTGVGETPTFKAVAAMTRIFEISNGSAVTIDGLVIDGKASTQSSYIGIDASLSALTLKNVTVLGPDASSSSGVNVDNRGLAKALNVNISNSVINGYQSNGLRAVGAVKLSVKASHLDASDGGRMSGLGSNGMTVALGSPGTACSVSKTTVMNNITGIDIQNFSKARISSNTLFNNMFGVVIRTPNNSSNSDGNKVTGNTIVGVPSNGIGIDIDYDNATTVSIKGTVVSKNVIYAAQYTPNGTAPTGIKVETEVPAQTTVTGTISGNTVWGFPVAINVDGNTGVKIGKNTILP